MAFINPHHLSSEQIKEILSTLDDAQLVTVERIRYKNSRELRSTQEFSIAVLKEFIRTCIENEDQPGGDLEVNLCSIGKKLVGQHDGVYWLEELSS